MKVTVEMSDAELREILKVTQERRKGAAIRQLALEALMLKKRRELLDEVEAGTWSVELPPIETLIQQFGVSVGTMREALRTLESEGLVTVQRGKFGGAVVRRPEANTAAKISTRAASARSAPGLSACFVLLTTPEPCSAKPITSPRVTLMNMAPSQ